MAAASGQVSASRTSCPKLLLCSASSCLVLAAKIAGPWVSTVHDPARLMPAKAQGMIMLNALQGALFCHVSDHVREVGRGHPGGTPTLPSRLGFLSTPDSRATGAGSPGMFNVPARWARPLCHLGLFHATKCHQQTSRTTVK